jgi:excisionase family DNA binding protein
VRFCALPGAELRVSSRFMDTISAQKLMTIPEVARVMNTSERFVEQRVATGELPSVKLGKLRRLHREVIEEFMKFGQVAEAQRWPRTRPEGE